LTFLIKKTITLLLMPLFVGLAMVWAGLILARTRRLRRAGLVLGAAGAIVVTLLSLQPVANEVIKPLEMCYPPLVELDGLRHVKWVVVLGGGHASNPDRPANLQIGTSTLARLVEGLRVLSHLPESRLLLSGGAVFDPVPEADTMSSVATALLGAGVDPVLERESRDTRDQARFIRIIVGDEPFVLATSAIHMPRAMLLFRQQGMNPVAAPAEITDFSNRELSPASFFPRAASLGKVEAAWHEYLGLLWTKLTG
jgi:uncharacterized SAM-binding protein YcdF (DUF218 family)